MKNKNLKSYIVGFALSVILTLSAYFAVIDNLLKGDILIATIFVIAIAQLIVQLVFFLHLGQESKPRWNLVIFISTIGLVFIIVIGSIWIMNHLNYNMSPLQMEKYTQSQDGF